MIEHSNYSIEFYEPGRAHSTVVDFPNLDAAICGAEKFRHIYTTNEVIGIIKWDMRQAFPDGEWIVNKKGVLSPVFYGSKSIH